jgi:hypothetical protein
MGKPFITCLWNQNGLELNLEEEKEEEEEKNLV